ncbi:hypothetical protein PCANC_06198 [Puccinia coronata f. sp. avenae]|uniref:Uncharacterized protein n=2 Tax=Puccinia coronata f. sp. avenae TaxID=200324 RepID=A0A2N5STV2_9BASI|nr:hypothetical protein PCASD_14549 [Puccinia coronata f. sp. avenae]PLW53316.1 hypothetical protein PCANC_06198 [Puccinia coronata f. sp. avenae]
MVAAIDIEALECAARGSPPSSPPAIPNGTPDPTPSSQNPTSTANTAKKAPKRKNNKRKRGKGQQDETNPTPNSVGAATTEGPLSIVTQKASKKQKKSLQTEQEQCPTPVEELVKLSVIELWKIAQDYSKQSMSDEDEEFFLALHQEQEKQQAIKAIESGVSLSMVFAILGRHIAVKEANRWNQFLQTDQARLIFAESGLGVKDKTVMKQLSEAYSLLSEEEKAALATNPNLNDSPAEEDSSSPVDCEDDTDPSINPNLLRGTVSAKDRYEKVQKAMNTWLEQAVHIAKTCSCEFVIIGVSKHLGPHSFQFTQCTPGAIESNNAIDVVDGDNRFVARLQSFISGQSVGQIAVAQKLGKTHTNLKGILTEWPWTETDHNLWAAGYKLQLSTKPAFCVEWLKSPTRDRKIVEVRLFLRELRLEKIRLIPRGAHEIEPTWDLNNPNVCPTCHQNKPAAGSLSPATHTQGNTASGGTNTFEAEDLGGNPTASTTNTS